MRTTYLLSGIVFLVLVTLLAFFLRPVGSESTVVNLLMNGNFEGGFYPDPTCGLVAEGWACFTIGNHTRFVAQPEEWQDAVRSGQRAQLLGVITPDPGAPPNRYIGIAQTVRVVPYTTYTLVLYGLIRADDSDPDPWRYEVQWGVAPDRNATWKDVDRWHTVPWYRYDARLQPGPYQSYKAVIRPSSQDVTLFVRLRVKWGTWPREVILNLDDLALLGQPPDRSPPATPATTPTMAPTSTPLPMPTREPTPTLPALVSPPVVEVLTATVPCTGTNLLVNGDFEAGFQPSGVAEGWQNFTSDGIGSFGFWDAGPHPTEEGDVHGQVIAINTMGLPPLEQELWAGISQPVSGLEPGAVYRACFWGRIATSKSITTTSLAECSLSTGDDAVWYTIPWLPGGATSDVLTYTAQFTATDPVHVFSIRIRQPVTVNVSEVALVLRRVHLQLVRSPQKLSERCTYVVQPGDTLLGLARRYGTTVDELVRWNGITNPNLLRIGQRLEVPCRKKPIP